MPDVTTLNAILDQLKSPGKTKGGVKASQDRAKAHLAKAKQLKAMVEELGPKHNIPPAVILGLMARESDFGEALDKGWGDNGNAFGVLQVDKRTAKPAGQPDPFSKAHVDQALGIWDGKLAEVRKAHKDWTEGEILAGTICAYNAGAGNIRTRPNNDVNWRKMDDNKPNTDYSADTWAMAAFYREAIWGKPTTDAKADAKADAKPDAAAAPPTDAKGGGNLESPWLKTLATAKLDNGKTGWCVQTTHANMTRLKIPVGFKATGEDPNNPRGGMVQMIKSGLWVSLQLPGSKQQTIKSPAYGDAPAYVIDAAAYEKIAKAGKAPSGAIIFQSRTGWNTVVKESHGNDMGIVRDGGKVTHNYEDMPAIIYKACKEVVLLVPK